MTKIFYKCIYWGLTVLYPTHQNPVRLIFDEQTSAAMIYQYMS